MKQNFYIHHRIGCQQARNLPNQFYSDRHSEITCPRCRAYIDHHHLVDRREYPDIPTFTIEFEAAQQLAPWQCPCCGLTRYMGRISGHRAALCDCWPNGINVTIHTVEQPQPAVRRGTPTNAFQPARVHYRNQRTGAVGCPGAYRYDTTNDPKRVTCIRCLKRLPDSTVEPQPISLKNRKSKRGEDNRQESDQNGSFQGINASGLRSARSVCRYRP